ncbi:MAG: DUF5312 domain-containing protein [Spirochaetota bacterium]|nr:DUF5312 domain-containing protein [Spirochaetota bacterium]
MSDKEYDKDTLKKLQSKGVFDSSLDPLVLSQSDEERKKLQEALKKDKESQAEKEKEDDKQPTLDTTKQIKKEETLCIRTLQFLQALFFGKKSAHSSKFFLKREMLAVIDGFSPLFYDNKIQKIKVNFPEYIYQIYKQLKQFDNLFEEIFLEDAEINFNSDILFLNFVDSLLTDDDKIFLESINKNYFFDIISKEQNSEETFKEKLNELKSRIEKYNKLTIMQYTSYFERLIILSQYGFYGFFKIFDPHFSEDPNYKPNFNPIFGDKGVRELQKINNYLILIDFQNIPENILIHLNNIINALYKKLELKKIDSEGKEKHEEHLDKLYNRLKSYKPNFIPELIQKINDLNNKNIIDALIKVMTDNYEYKPSVIPKKEGFLLKRYIKLTIAKKWFQLKRSYNEIKANIIQDKIMSFFNVTSVMELSKIENYNGEISEKLVEKGLEGFRYVQLLSIFKTFYEKMYDNDIRKKINKLLVEGDFLKKREQSLFSEAYYTLDKVIESLSAIESELREEEKDVGQILRFSRGEIPDSGYQIVIQRKLSDLEIRINNILKDGMQHYKTILDNLKLAIDDWKTSKPQYISNIKTVAGSSNKSFLNDVIKAEANISYFIELVYSFGILQN